MVRQSVSVLETTAGATFRHMHRKTQRAAAAVVLARLPRASSAATLREGARRAAVAEELTKLRAEARPSQRRCGSEEME